MIVAIYYRDAAEYQREAAFAFAQGLRRHGVEPIMINSVVAARPVDCDLAVFWGHRAGHIIAHQRRAGRRYLVMERGYIGDRFAWTSLGFDGLNGRAEFCNRGADPDRLDRFFPNLIQPWRTGGEYALILGQVAGDAALSTLPGGDLNRFYMDLANQAERLGLPIKFRPHPKSITLPPKLPLIGGDLSEALANAAVTIAFNSNSLVDAVLSGVPSITIDPGAMAWPVSSHDFEAPLIRPDRRQWAAELAHAQWSLTEIAAGDAWDRLRFGVTGLNTLERIEGNSNGIDARNTAGC